MRTEAQSKHSLYSPSGDQPPVAGFWIPANAIRLDGRFGANVRRERVTARLTPEKLAEKADLDIRTLQSIESGKLNVPLTTAIRIHNALRCDWADPTFATGEYSGA